MRKEIKQTNMSLCRNEADVIQQSNEPLYSLTTDSLRFVPDNFSFFFNIFLSLYVIILI